MSTPPTCPGPWSLTFRSCCIAASVKYRIRVPVRRLLKHVCTDCTRSHVPAHEQHGGVTWGQHVVYTTMRSWIEA